MDERNFSGRVVPAKKGFVVEMEMSLPTLVEANMFAEWIQQIIKDKVASVSGVVLPNSMTLGKNLKQ